MKGRFTRELFPEKAFPIASCGGHLEFDGDDQIARGTVPRGKAPLTQAELRSILAPGRHLNVDSAFQGGNADVRAQNGFPRETTDARKINSRS